MRLQRVGHDWVTKHSTTLYITVAIHSYFSIKFLLCIFPLIHSRSYYCGIGFQNPLWYNYKALVDPNPAFLLWVSPFRILLWGWSSLNLLSLIDYNRVLVIVLHSFPDGSVVKRIHLQCGRHKRHGFNPWIGKILWRRKWQPTLVFLPKENPIDREAWQLQSIGSHRVRQDWSNWAHTHTCIWVKRLLCVSPCESFKMWLA